MRLVCRISKFKFYSIARPPSSPFQTGGPDGDLGSNEIKQGIERTVGVVDGSGVLCDPVGIDAAELRRLAGLRKPIEFFDRSKLSKDVCWRCCPICGP